MENSEDNTPNLHSQTTGSVAPANIETQPSSYRSIIHRWRREDLLKKGQVVLRTSGLLFSLLSFIIMAANKHGNGWENFDKYEEYRYLLAIALLSTLYTIAQVLRQIHEFSTGKYILSLRGLNYLDFIGDQIMAYLLVSAASTAVPLTNRMREGADNIFTDSSSASISMAFLAFVVVASSALISGYKLSTQTYI
ncbi:CASP-like protein 4B1 [Macadamia integrifolia]|uniref:CASP-like protein 4B1 n=1 Tax=Macadamia integrifolia TaxID=60698 RepID=UPI001C4FEA67|nr:CASP-like protein 4B1 [Macadamia integrifolia]